MTPHRYVDNLVAKSCKRADVYDEGTLNYVFIEGVDLSGLHRLKPLWAAKLQVNFTDILFLVESLPLIQKGAGITSGTN